MRTRLAPTPSGLLHRGNAFNFLVTEQLARHFGAHLLLRIDDLDAERARPGYVADIFANLTWLGITWQEGPRDAEELHRTWSQHLRIPRYEQALEHLRAEGHLYACACTRQTQVRCGCRARGLSFAAPAVSWRLHLQDVVVPFTDLLMHGPIRLQDHLQDPVLRQRNGRPAYQIASLVDDEAMQMDLIVRGEDLFPSTMLQLYLAELLGFDHFQRTTFLHHPLLRDAAGEKLSKSNGADALNVMREQGVDPEALRREALAFLQERFPIGFGALS